MNKNYETVEERIRNVIGPMWNLALIIKNLQDPNKSLKEKQALYDYIIDSTDLPNIMYKGMTYLINIGKEVDKVLPKEYSINDHVKY